MKGPGWRRWLRHLWIGPMHVGRAFPPDAMRRIEEAVAAGERRHRAEVRFAVESSLDSGRLWRGVTARQRAQEVFAQFGVWDTADNNGVLIYLLWADQTVEIVADRGATAAVDPAVWARACAQLVDGCRDGRQLEGALRCLEALEAGLVRAFPADGSRDNPDELPNTPIRLG